MSSSSYFCCSKFSSCFRTLHWIIARAYSWWVSRSVDFSKKFWVRRRHDEKWCNLLCDAVCTCLPTLSPPPVLRVSITLSGCLCCKLWLLSWAPVPPQEHPSDSLFLYWLTEHFKLLPQTSLKTLHTFTMGPSPSLVTALLLGAPLWTLRSSATQSP